MTPHLLQETDRRKSICSLIAEGLTCRSRQAPLFQPLSFSLTSGSGLWIEGPNGIGKSTLLRLLAGFKTCEPDTLIWNHACIQSISDYQQQLHYLGHANGLRSGLTVMENLQLFAELAEQPLVEWPSLLSALQLDSIQNKFVSQLSAGQQRKAALARIFLIPRRLWILDEPLTALDTQSQQLVMMKIHDHLQQGGLCVLTSHQSLPADLLSFKRVELIAC